MLILRLNTATGSERASDGEVVSRVAWQLVEEELAEITIGMIEMLTICGKQVENIILK